MFLLLLSISVSVIRVQDNCFSACRYMNKLAAFDKAQNVCVFKSLCAVTGSLGNCNV